MSDHAVGVDLYYSGDWHDRPAYVREGITLSRGAPGEGQDSPPSTVSLTFANPDGALSPGNPASPLYGLVGRNTPLRVRADGATRATVELGTLELDRTLDADGVQGDAWATVEGGGILRRLQQGKTPLRSALERAILASGPHAFWPLSDPKEATALVSAVDGVDALTLYGARPGEVPGPVAAGGASFVDVAGAPVSARGPFPAGLSASGWGMDFMFYVGDPDTSGQTEQRIISWSMRGAAWDVFVGIFAGGRYVIVGGGAGLDEAAVANDSADGTVVAGWNYGRVLFEQIGSNLDMELWVNGSLVDTDTAAGGTLGVPVGDIIVGQVTDPITAPLVFDLAGVGMLAFYDLANADDHSDAATGYVGELAGNRFARVLGEEGVAAFVIGDPDDTQPMGPQLPDTLVSIARLCVRTDDGLMFEPIDERGLAMRTGRSMRNQDAVATLSFLDGFGPGFKPTYDDRGTRNDITATRPGSSVGARAQKLSGALNVNDPADDPDGVGRYDVTVAVNPATDDALTNHAYWHLSKGTVDEPRYPTVTLDLDASPSLVATVHPLDIGDRLDVEDMPADWAQEPIALILLGVKENYPAGGGDFRRTITLNVAPYSPYEVLLVGNTAGSVDLRGQRVGTELSTVDGDHIPADTTILIDSGGITWTTSAADFDVTKNGGGMFLMLAGELVRVTSISGAGSAWTLTVVRAVNGVSITIPDGTPVRFRYPGRLGL